MNSSSPATIETMVESCIAGRVRLLNRVITNIYDEALRPYGLKLSQGTILAMAASMGIARPAEVCTILELDHSTLSRTVERMVQKGWLEILPDTDGRSHPFRLTDEGKTLMQQAMPAWEQAQQQAEELFGESGLQVLNQAITRYKSAHKPG
ncbi:MAG: MarR family winged helix-turn-helix transcriptional regulator [Zavarzinella sp.]